MPSDTLYKSDFFQWTEQQAAALRRAARARANAPLDGDNLAGEIASLRGRDRREAKSHVANIVRHRLNLGGLPAIEPRVKWKRETGVFAEPGPHFLSGDAD